MQRGGKSRGLESFWPNLFEHNTGRCLKLGVQMTFCVALAFLEIIFGSRERMKNFPLLQTHLTLGEREIGDFV